MLIGAHVSIAKGVYLAISRGEEIGANAIQIFSKNQSQWVGKPLTEEDAEKFKHAWQKSTIEAVVIHDSYLINLGSPDDAQLVPAVLALFGMTKEAAKSTSGKKLAASAKKH